MCSKKMLLRFGRNEMGYRLREKVEQLGKITIRRIVETVLRNVYHRVDISSWNDRRTSSNVCLLSSRTLNELEPRHIPYLHFKVFEGNRYLKAKEPVLSPDDFYSIVLFLTLSRRAIAWARKASVNGSIKKHACFFLPPHAVSRNMLSERIGAHLILPV